VRIEDTVLVTKEGCEILSRDVPREIDQIERLMSEKGPALPLQSKNRPAKSMQLTSQSDK
jgi:hypothetical protein